MGMKKGVCLLLACIVSMGCLAFPAGAFDIEENVTEITERRATGHFDGLDPDDPDGVGFYNTFTYYGNLASGEEDSIYMQAHGSIGYAYVYVDEETGGFNNSTWYAMQSSSGRIDVYN